MRLILSLKTGPYSGFHAQLFLGYCPVVSCMVMRIIPNFGNQDFCPVAGRFSHLLTHTSPHLALFIYWMFPYS